MPIALMHQFHQSKWPELPGRGRFPQNPHPQETIARGGVYKRP